MALLSLKTGNSIDVIGAMQINGKPHFVCSITPFYNNGLLIRYVVIPAHKFNVNDAEFVEVVNDTMHSEETTKNNEPISIEEK